MPTTIEEAQHITELISEYLGPRVASELTARLHKEVGEKTDNDSLKVTLKMLYTLCRDFPWKDGNPHKTKWGDDH